MIKTTAIILEELKQYASPASKLSRMVKKGEYIPIIKGLYETDASTPGYLFRGVFTDRLTCLLSSPSHIMV
jgi:hypothetical protein